MLFCAITQRTGWTPQQISELTIGQLRLYIGYWTRDMNSGYDKDGTGLIFEDIGTFNEVSGIKRIKKAVK